MHRIVLGSAEPPLQQAQGWDVSSWDAEGCVLLGDTVLPAPENLQPSLKPFRGAGPLTLKLCLSVPGDVLSQVSSLKEDNVRV